MGRTGKDMGRGKKRLRWGDSAMVGDEAWNTVNYIIEITLLKNGFHFDLLLLNKV
jgi:hypothetical protein